MRLAIIAAAGAKPSPDPLLGERDASLIASRLGLDDLGFEVVIIDPGVDLAEQLDEILLAHEGNVDALLFYASCLLAVVDEGDCFLCLDPNEPDVGDALADVAEVLASARAPQSLAVFELRFDQPGVTRGMLSDVFDAVAASVEPERTGLELIAAVRPLDAHPERIPSRLTAGLLEQIDASDEPLTARRAYAAAIQSADLGTWPHAVGHRPGAAAFFLRPEAHETHRTHASAPPATASSLPPVTEPDPPTAPSVGVVRDEASRTSPDGSFALADANGEDGPEAPPELAGEQETSAAEHEASAAEHEASDAEHEASEKEEDGVSEAEGETAEAAPEEALAPIPAIVPPPPPVPEPPPPSGPRPPPESERKESSSVSWPPKRARPTPIAQPKVVIGRAPESERPGRRPAARSLLDTSADGPDAKRLREAAERAIRDAESARGVAAAPKNGSNVVEIADEISDEISIEDEISADVEIAVEGEALLTTRSSAPPPPSLRKKVAEMTVDDHIEAGDLARRLGHDDEAVSHYKKGLAKLGTAQTPERATIYVRIGELMRKAGNQRLAISNFDKALQIVADHRTALEHLIALESERESWRNVGVLEDRLAASLDGDERMRMLLASGDRWSKHDRRKTRERYEEAQRAFPRALEPLERLLRYFEEEGAVDHALDMRRRIADRIEDPRQRARYYLDLGEKCLFELGREDEAYAAFELALDADPTLLQALEVLSTALAESQEWGELERVYAKMIDKFSAREQDEATVTVLGELHHRSALLFRDHLEDPSSALEAVERELELRPDSLSAQLMAADLAIELEQGQRALAHLRTAAKLVPHRAETYRQIFKLGQRFDAPEISYLASSVVHVLGSADDRERIIYQEHRPTGVPSLHGALDDDAWYWLLAEREPEVDAVMCAIAPAVLRLRVRQLEAEGTLFDLPAEARQDLASSTLSVVRSIAWASQFLAIPAPAVYLLDEAPAPLWAPFAREQSTVIARDAIRGRTVSELAFLVGRHLTMRLPEHELVAHLTNVDELTACFLAAIRIILGTAPASGEIAGAAQKLAPLLAEQQTPAEREALKEAVEAFSAAGGRVNLRAWIASVDRSATRAGLVLCGDLDTAVRVLREEGDSPLSTVSERLDDLFAFAVSAEHARVRQCLGCSLEGADEPAPVSAIH